MFNISICQSNLIILLCCIFCPFGMFLCSNLYTTLYQHIWGYTTSCVLLYNLQGKKVWQRKLLFSEICRENFKMQNLLTYFPIVPTRTHPVSRLLATLLIPLEKMRFCIPRHYLPTGFTDEPVSFKSALENDKKESCAVTPLFPKRVVAGFFFPIWTLWLVVNRVSSGGEKQCTIRSIQEMSSCQQLTQFLCTVFQSNGYII